MAREEHLVVVGGGAAGMSAASRARRRAPELKISVFEHNSYVSHIACGLPYYISDVIKDHQQLLVYSPDFFRKERRIQVYTRHQVERIDTQAQALRVVNLDTGERWSQPFSRLILATGGGPLTPRIEGIGLENIFTLHTIEHGIAIKDFIRRERPRRAAIVGGGYIGLEMAEALGLLGIGTTLIEALPHVMAVADPEISEVIEGELRERGLDLRLGEPVQGFEGSGRVRQVVTSQGRYEVDFVILAIGVRAKAELAREAGITLGESGAVQVDQAMATNLPGVYAAGDAAEAQHLVTGRPAYIPLGTTANKQGRVAGENAAGGQAAFPGVVGTAITKVFDLGVGRTGLTEAQARQAGFEPISSFITHHSRARFYPGAMPVYLKLLADRASGRLLGAQIAGKDGVAKRIDVAAAAIQMGLSASALPDLDLSYAPPFSPVWEAVQIGAQELEKRLARR
jgi:NADPH-dependent 2,4-dienoyl-CoA reductase/sulfur reductase-like enzyme